MCVCVCVCVCVSDKTRVLFRKYWLRGAVHTQTATWNIISTFVGGWVFRLDVFTWQFGTKLIFMKQTNKTKKKWFICISLLPYGLVWANMINFFYLAHVLCRLEKKPFSRSSKRWGSGILLGLGVEKIGGFIFLMQRDHYCTVVIAAKTSSPLFWVWPWFVVCIYLYCILVVTILCPW